MAKVANPKIFEKYVCTGTFLYEYVPANSVIRIHDMPKNAKIGAQESFLSFLFGMTAEEAKTRYAMELVVPNPPDKHYHYIRIKPKLQTDQTDFVEARLSLYRAHSLPAQIWYLQPNKNEITWNFTQLQLNREIPLKLFEPTQPQGWRVERVQPKGLAPGQPTIRN
jgi:TIGR03009 family protein